MHHTTRLFVLAATLCASTIPAGGAGIDPALQAKINARIRTLREWAADPAIVRAVREINATMPPAHAAMTQEKWASLSVLDPFVRAFTRNEAAAALKNRKTDEVAEAFVSAARGTKVGFLSKPTNWSHKGKPKHEGPMSGKTWQGEIEVDESTGLQQIQVAVPVVDSGKPIGSLVVGLAVSKLR